MSSDSPRTQSSRRRPAIVGGAVAAVALALATSGSLAALTASITNSTNTAGVGSLLMTETGPDSTGTSQTCTTSATSTSVTCSTINKYGGSTTMTTTGTNSSKTTTITISNPGTLAASTFTLVPGTCTLTNPSSATGDLCSTAKITIVQGTTTVVNGLTPSAMAGNTYTLTPVAAGGSSSITITVDTSGADDTVMGESISQPLTWTFNA